MPPLDESILQVHARAPLKAILSGEHSVLYGYPCIAMALNLYTSGRARILRDNKYPPRLPFPILLDSKTGDQLDLSSSMKEAICLINEEALRRLNAAGHSDTPCHYCESIELVVHKWALGKGLGSSASILVTHTALLLAASSIYSHSAVFDIALLGENHIHGRTTGMDLKTVICGGIQIYGRGALCSSKIASDIFLTRNIQIFIADSGITKSTAKAVELVRQRQSGDILEKIGSVSMNLIELLSNANDGSQTSDEVFCQALSALLKQNHNLLRSLGVSVAETEHSMDSLYRMGCFAAKLTGAGLGGCCIGLRSEGDSAACIFNAHILEVGVGEGLLVTNTTRPI